MSKRLSFIDIARAFAIIFIVFGHTIVHNSNAYWLYKLLYSFHVILFFLISGYLYKPQSPNLEFFFKKFLSLMVPYFIFASLFLIPYFLFGREVSSSINTTSSNNFFVLLTQIIYGIGANGALKQNLSLWFLPALFTTEVIYKFLTDSNLFQKLTAPLRLLIFLIISFLATKITIILPWGLNSALTLMLFFEIGFFLRQYKVLEKIANKTSLQGLLIVVTIISCFIYQTNVTVSCADYRYGNYLVFLLVSLSLSIFIMFISYQIKTSKILELIGKNTLSILIFHKLFVIIFQTKISVTSTSLIAGSTLNCLLVGSIVTIISILISLLIGFIITKYFPFLYGRRRVKVDEKN